MPNFDLNIKAARIKMLIEIMKEESKWNFLARSYFKVLDSRFKIQYFAIFADDSSDLILQSEIPLFYKEVILAFHELCKKGKQCLSNEPLWYNSKINHRGKSLCYMNWVNSGICFLSDIIRNSNINDDIIFSKLQNRTNCFSELMTVKKSIPNDMIRSVSDSECIPNFCDLFFHVPYRQDSVNVLNLSTHIEISALFIDTSDKPK